MNKRENIKGRGFKGGWTPKKRSRTEKREMMPDTGTPCYNILVLGKTGTGKTALLNYLFGTSLPSGAGESCTAKGIHPKSVLFEGKIYNLFDTGGLEAGDVDIWCEEVFDRVAERNNAADPEKWFHGIFYCFSANSARIEDFELKDVLVPLLKTGSPVVAVFTHAEKSFNKAEKISGMKERLIEGLAEFMPELPRSAYPAMVELVSVDSENMAGERFFRKGAADLLSVMENGVSNMVAKRIPAIYENFAGEKLEKWRDDSLELIEKGKITFFAKAENAAEMEYRIDRELQHIILHIYLQREALLSASRNYLSESCDVLPPVLHMGLGTEFRDAAKKSLFGKVRGSLVRSEAGIRKKLSYNVNKIFHKFLLSFRYRVYQEK